MQIKLTTRERQVHELVFDGKSNKAIAEELEISINTVKTHVAKILHKRGAKNRIELITKNLMK